jgi:hypothetical protein
MVLYWLLGLTLLNLVLLLLVLWYVRGLKRDSSIITDVLVDVVSRIDPPEEKEERL